MRDEPTPSCFQCLVLRLLLVLMLEVGVLTVRIHQKLNHSRIGMHDPGSKLTMIVSLFCFKTPSSSLQS
jgi:hypothetical protein